MYAPIRVEILHFNYMNGYLLICFVYICITNALFKTAMNNLISQLIKSEARVIIPGFGAFIINREDGNVDISFNQYLNFDDSLLVNAVAQKYGVDAQQAKTDVQAYAKQLNDKLDQGETVVITGVGYLVKNDGRIEFTYAPDQEASSEVGSEIEFVATPSAEPVSEEPVPTPQPQAEPTPQPQKEPKPEYRDYPQERKSVWLWIVIIILLFLGLIYLCLFVINKDNAVYEYFYPAEEEVIEEPAPVQPDTTVVAEPSPVVTEEVVEKPEKRYNIVVVTSGRKADAERKVEQLKAKGFENAFVSTFRDKYVAVIEAYSSLVEAEARQEYIVDTYRIESYITNGGE